VYSNRETEQAVEMDSDLEAEEFFKTLSVTATEVV
jgi:hypothetical protein